MERWVILGEALVPEFYGIDEHMGDNWSDELVEGEGTYSVSRCVLHYENQCT
jgi:hypothetical protein